MELWINKKQVQTKHLKTTTSISKEIVSLGDEKAACQDQITWFPIA